MAIRPPGWVPSPRPDLDIDNVVLIENERAAQREAARLERTRQLELQQDARDAQQERDAIRTIEQAEEARAMRCAGAKYHQIAARLGVSMSVAYDRTARLLCGTCVNPCK